MKTILNIQEKHEVNNYPYGRLKCTAYFSIEFKKNKGFRNVFQTINPKTGKLNAPKNGTYSHLMWNQRNEENSHIENGAFTIWGFEDLNKCAKFIAENQSSLQLTQEMMNDIYMTMITCARGSVAYTPKEITSAVLEVIKSSMDACVKGLKDSLNTFSEINIDVEAIENLKKDYQRSLKTV